MIKIVIDGTNRLNKGAELMLAAILEQIETHSPNASVVFNDRHSGIDFGSYDTPLSFSKPWRLRFGHYPWGILSLLKFPSRFFTEQHPVTNSDLVLDASGFRFGDQWNHSQAYLDDVENYLSKVSGSDAKIIFLPQAFGPFKTDSGKRSASILKTWADLLIAREEDSRKHLLDAGLSDDNVMCFSDFTLAVHGLVPPKYTFLKDSVCIIPNRKLFSHGGINKKTYVNRVKNLISYLHELGYSVFILNHEGVRDLRICKEIQRSVSKKIPIVSGLNARETKGVIGQSSLVITSRYHGLASALNQGIPCIATSWSHKYERLFEDFGIQPLLWNPLDPDVPKTLIQKLTHPATSNEIKKTLMESKNDLLKKNSLMWKYVWEHAAVE